MKKSILSLALLLMLMQAFCQEPINPILTKEDYLRKSRTSKTAGWILLGSGVGMLVGSAATYEFVIDFGPMFGAPPSPSHVDNTASTLLAIGGVCGVVGSIISFSAAKRNKRLAATVTVINQRIPLLQQSTMVSKVQPALCLRLPL